MCGRFQFSVTQCPALQPIRNKLAQQQALPCWPDDQIAPSDRAPVLVAGTAELTLALMTWGFPWPGRQPVIHARAETLLERPMFRDAAIQRRCIVPASAFYERDHARQQFRFSLRDNQPLYMAGVWTNGVVWTVFASSPPRPITPSALPMAGCPCCFRRTSWSPGCWIAPLCQHCSTLRSPPWKVRGPMGSCSCGKENV